MPPLRTANCVEVLDRVKASLAALTAGAALTRPPHFTRRHLSKRRGISKTEERRRPMTERSLTPNITVTIGHHTRVYFAFVTTAPTELDSPATVTLHAATLADVVTLAAEPVTFDSTRSRTPARLVLVDAMELAWQRAKYRGHQHALLPADPGLVGLNTLQHWLWQRLQTPAASQVAA